MRGQFMLISAVVAGLIMITVGAVISDIEAETFEPEDFQHKSNYLNEEAEEITEDGSIEQIEEHNYEKMVRNLDFDSDVSFGEDCVNVTLERPGERYFMECMS